MEDLPQAPLLSLPFGQDAPPAVRIGLIVLASEYTLEAEARTVWQRLGAEVALYQSRIANDPIITPESLAAMGPRLTETASRLLPGCPLDVIGYGCTSASTTLGEAAVISAIREAKPEAAVTNPITGALAGFQALGVRRIGLITPYTADVTGTMRAYLEAAGIEVVVAASFQEPDDQIVARISRASLAEAVRQIAETGPEAVFVSCTSIRLMAEIDALETALGLPVISSNQALLWHVLSLAGVPRPRGFGRLFDL
ncbi:MAG: aspartate/glutamate racemase family protein [Pseudomonadota bacterium]